MESHHTDHLMTWADSIPPQQQLYEVDVDMKPQLTQLKSSSKSTDLSRQSSSSSSLGSLSGGSSEYSDFLFTIANSSCLPDHDFNGVIPNQAIQPIPSLPVQFPATITPGSPFDRSGNTQFRSSYTNDDAAIMRAMLAVLSSSSSTPSSSGRAFQPYRSMGNKKIRPMITNCRPNMSKVLISILRGINNKRMAESVIQETPPPQPTTNQLHHMISERKRREKLNESFQALRSQLPRGTRKDKASVLAATKEYMTYLKGQISELEEKNRALEMNLFESDDENDDEFGISGERVIFDVKKTSEVDTLGLKQIDVRIRVRVESDDIIELILQILDSMKEMGNIDLVSLNHLSKRAGLVIQIKTMDVAWNEVEFRKKITRAVDVSKGTLQSTQGQEP